MDSNDGIPTTLTDYQEEIILGYKRNGYSPMNPDL
jgi:hypothetical protein